MLRSIRFALPACLLAGAAAACVPTPYAGLTAVVVNPAQPVEGEVDATGCNIGVYFDAGSGVVSNAEIHGATHFGVLVNAATSDVHVDVLDSDVHDIGNVPFDGVQIGVGIHYRAYFANSATGRIGGNDVRRYQKSGIVVNGHGTNVTVRDNVVEGLGPVGFIAQNGIQVGWGATAQVSRNFVADNSYTGTSTVSSGIVVVGGPCYGLCPDGNPCEYTLRTKVMNNTVVDNDIGVFLTNLNGVDCGFPEVPTAIMAVSNDVSNGAVTGGYGYQAGISDVGSGDKLMANRITGAGYQPVPGDVPYLREIDADPSFTHAVKAHGNK